MAAIVDLIAILKWREWCSITREADQILLESKIRFTRSDEIFKVLVVAEDRRFGSHPGFDVIGIGRAIYRRFTTNRLEGASTIAQQLVRTLTNKRDVSIGRKINEILLASIFTRRYHTEDIVNCYLNIAYFGWGMKGIEQTSERFGYNISNFSRLEAANLISRLKYPQQKNPTVGYQIKREKRIEHLLELRRLSIDPIASNQPLQHPCESI